MRSPFSHISLLDPVVFKQSGPGVLHGNDPGLKYISPAIPKTAWTFCSISRTVVPFWLISLRIVKILLAIRGTKPSEGSSNIRSLGLAIRPGQGQASAVPRCLRFQQAGVSAP
jgi:hypothetical protein